MNWIKLLWTGKNRTHTLKNIALRCKMYSRKHHMKKLGPPHQQLTQFKLGHNTAANNKQVYQALEMLKLAAVLVAQWGSSSVFHFAKLTPPFLFQRKWTYLWHIACRVKRNGKSKLTNAQKTKILVQYFVNEQTKSSKHTSPTRDSRQELGTSIALAAKWPLLFANNVLRRVVSVFN